MPIVSFIESPRFPEDISYGSGGGPQFFNNSALSPVGKRKVNIRRTQPLGSYTVGKTVQTQEQLDELHALHMVCYGSALGFRFKDWGDYRVTAGQGILKPTADGKHQLYKRYSFGSQTFDRIIQKPVEGTVELTGGTGTVDYTTGLVSGATATGWTGEFDVPVAFTGDQFHADIANFQAYNANLQLQIIEP